MQAYTYLIHYCKAKIMRYMSAHYYGLLDNKARDLLKSELLKYKIDGKIFCQNNWTYDEIIFFIFLFVSKNFGYAIHDIIFMINIKKLS